MFLSSLFGDSQQPQNPRKRKSFRLMTLKKFIAKTNRADFMKV